MMMVTFLSFFFFFSTWWMMAMTLLTAWGEFMNDVMKNNIIAPPSAVHVDVALPVAIVVVGMEGGCSRRHYYYLFSLSFVRMVQYYY